MILPKTPTLVDNYHPFLFSYRRTSLLLLEILQNWEIGQKENHILSKNKSPLVFCDINPLKRWIKDDSWDFDEATGCFTFFSLLKPPQYGSRPQQLIQTPLAKFPVTSCSPTPAFILVDLFVAYNGANYFLLLANRFSSCSMTCFSVHFLPSWEYLLHVLC